MPLPYYAGFKTDLLQLRDNLMKQYQKTGELDVLQIEQETYVRRPDIFVVDKVKKTTRKKPSGLYMREAPTNYSEKIGLFMERIDQVINNLDYRIALEEKAALQKKNDKEKKTYEDRRAFLEAELEEAKKQEVTMRERYFTVFEERYADEQEAIANKSADLADKLSVIKTDDYKKPWEEATVRIEELQERLKVLESNYTEKKQDLENRIIQIELKLPKLEERMLNENGDQYAEKAWDELMRELQQEGVEQSNLTEDDLKKSAEPGEMSNYDKWRAHNDLVAMYKDLQSLSKIQEYTISTSTFDEKSEMIDDYESEVAFRFGPEFEGLTEEQIYAKEHAEKDPDEFNMAFTYEEDFNNRLKEVKKKGIKVEDGQEFKAIFDNIEPDKTKLNQLKNKIDTLNKDINQIREDIVKIQEDSTITQEALDNTPEFKVTGLVSPEEQIKHLKDLEVKDPELVKQIGIKEQSLKHQQEEVDKLPKILEGKKSVIASQENVYNQAKEAEKQATTKFLDSEKEFEQVFKEKNPQGVDVNNWVKRYEELSPLDESKNIAKLLQNSFDKAKEVGFEKAKTDFEIKNLEGQIAMYNALLKESKERDIISSAEAKRLIKEEKKRLGDLELKRKLDEKKKEQEKELNGLLDEIKELEMTAPAEDAFDKVPVPTAPDKADYEPDEVWDEEEDEMEDMFEAESQFFQSKFPKWKEMLIRQGKTLLAAGDNYENGIALASAHKEKADSEANSKRENDLKANKIKYEQQKDEVKSKYSKETVQKTYDLIAERQVLLEEGNKKREELEEKHSIENSNIDNYLEKAIAELKERQQLEYEQEKYKLEELAIDSAFKFMEDNITIVPEIGQLRKEIKDLTTRYDYTIRQILPDKDANNSGSKGILNNNEVLKEEAKRIQREIAEKTEQIRQLRPDDTEKQQNLQDLVLKNEIDVRKALKNLQETHELEVAKFAEDYRNRLAQSQKEELAQLNIELDKKETQVINAQASDTLELYDQLLTLEKQEGKDAEGIEAAYNQKLEENYQAYDRERKEPKTEDEIKKEIKEERDKFFSEIDTQYNHRVYRTFLDYEQEINKVISPFLTRSKENNRRLIQDKKDREEMMRKRHDSELREIEEYHNQTLNIEVDSFVNETKKKTLEVALKAAQAEFSKDEETLNRYYAEKHTLPYQIEGAKLEAKRKVDNFKQKEKELAQKETEIRSKYKYDPIKLSTNTFNAFDKYHKHYNELFEKWTDKDGNNYKNSIDMAQTKMQLEAVKYSFDYQYKEWQKDFLTFINAEPNHKGKPEVKALSETDLNNLFSLGNSVTSKVEAAFKDVIKEMKVDGDHNFLSGFSDDTEIKQAFQVAERRVLYNEGIGQKDWKAYELYRMVMYHEGLMADVLRFSKEARHGVDLESPNPLAFNKYLDSAIEKYNISNNTPSVAPKEKTYKKLKSNLEKALADYRSAVLKETKVKTDIALKSYDAQMDKAAAIHVMNKAEDEVKELENEQKTLDKRIKNMEEASLSATGKITQLKMYEEAFGENKKIGDSLGKAKIRLEVLKAKRNTLEQQAVDTKNEIEEIQTNLAEKIKNYSGDVFALKDNLIEKFRLVRAAKNEYTAKVAAETKKLIELQKNEEALLKTYKKLDKDGHLLYEIDIFNLEEEKEQHNVDTASARADASKKDIELSKVLLKLEELKANKSTDKKVLSECQNEIQSIIAEKKQLEARVKELAVKDEAYKIANVRVEILKQQSVVNEMQAYLDQAVRTGEGLEKEVDEFRKNVKTFTEKRKNHSDELLTALNNLKQGLEDFKKTETETIKKRDDEKAAYDKLVSDLETVRTDKELTTKNIAHIKEQNDKKAKEQEDAYYKAIEDKKKHIKANSKKIEDKNILINKNVEEIESTKEAIKVEEKVLAAKKKDMQNKFAHKSLVLDKYHKAQSNLDKIKKFHQSHTEKISKDLANFNVGDKMAEWDAKMAEVNDILAARAGFTEVFSHVVKKTLSDSDAYTEMMTALRALKELKDEKNPENAIKKINEAQQKAEHYIFVRSKDVFKSNSLLRRSRTAMAGEIVQLSIEFRQRYNDIKDGKEKALKNVNKLTEASNNMKKLVNLNNLSSDKKKEYNETFRDKYLNPGVQKNKSNYGYLREKYGYKVINGKRVFNYNNVKMKSWDATHKWILSSDVINVPHSKYKTSMDERLALKETITTQIKNDNVRMRYNQNVSLDTTYRSELKKKNIEIDNLGYSDLDLTEQQVNDYRKYFKPEEYDQEYIDNVLKDKHHEQAEVNVNAPQENKEVVQNNINNINNIQNENVNVQINPNDNIAKNIINGGNKETLADRLQQLNERNANVQKNDVDLVKAGIKQNDPSKVQREEKQEKKDLEKVKDHVVNQRGFN